MPHRYSHDGRYRAAGVAIIAQEGSYTACPDLSSEVGYSALMLLELVIDLWSVGVIPVDFGKGWKLTGDLR